MGRWGRQRREVSITVSAATAEELLAIVEARRKEVRRAAGLWAWTRSGGRVRARTFATSRFQPVPPHFAGRFVADEPGGRLAGSIIESWPQVLIPRAFGAMAVLLILGDLAVVAGSFSVAGLVVCTVGAIALGWLAHLMGRGRPGDFATGADELKRLLTRLVPPAPGQRSRRSRRG